MFKTGFPIRNFDGILLFFLVGIILIPMTFESFSAEAEIRAEDLELTPDQVQTLKSLNRQFYREQAQIRKKIMVKRMEYRALSAEEFRGEKGEEIRSQIQSLLLQSRERALFYRQEAFRIYTPEQQKKISPLNDLGFHCGGGFRRGGRRGAGTGPELRP